MRKRFNFNDERPQEKPNLIEELKPEVEPPVLLLGVVAAACVGLAVAYLIS